MSRRTLDAPVGAVPSLQPSMHAAPAAIASLLGHGIPTGLVERMLAQPRLRERLDASLSDRLGSWPGEANAAQAAIVALDPAGLTRLALRAGASWHAARIARVYDGEGVRALVERVGPEFREAALADLAARKGAPPPSEAGDVAVHDLPSAIARDGTACLVAWCEAQPRPVGWRVLLRTRINARPSPAHVQAGPAIIDRIAIPGGLF